MKAFLQTTFFLLIMVSLMSGIAIAQQRNTSNGGKQLNTSSIPLMNEKPANSNQQVLGRSGEEFGRSSISIDGKSITKKPEAINQDNSLELMVDYNGITTSIESAEKLLEGITLSGKDVLLDESFETWEPEGWSLYQIGVQWVGWLQSDATPHSGNFCASHGYYAGGLHDNWMVSPQMTVDQVYNLVFWDRFTDYNYYEYSGVLISTGSGDPASGDFVEIYNANSASPLEWVEHTYDLTPYIGQDIYLAFQYQGDNAHKWFVDDVKIAPLTFVDGGVTNITNPPVETTTVGGSLEDVTISLKNFGTDLITEASIEWMVNGEAQTSYLATGLNLVAEESTEIVLGEYDFSAVMDYEISATSLIDDDQNAANNNFTGTYTVGDFGNAGITSISPNGQMAAAIFHDVVVSIKNYGTDVLESVEVEWAVNGEVQEPFQATNLALGFGETAQRMIGQFDFTQADYYTILAGTNIPIDYVPANDTMSVLMSSALLREGFEGPHDDFWPPDHWLSLNASPLSDWPYEGDYMGHILSGASEFGATDGWLATPLLDISTGDFINFQLSFDLASGGGFSVNWMDGETGEMYFIQDVSVTPGEWFEQNIDISSAAGINRIVFKVHSEAYAESFLDLVTCTAPVYTFENDLETMRFEQNWTPAVNELTTITGKVRNYSSNNVAGSDYTVKLMEEPGVELASMAGVDIEALGIHVFEFEYTFTDEDQHNLYIEIDYAEDDDPDDNISNIVSVYPNPPTTESIEIGDGDIGSLGIPFDTFGTEGWGEDDFTQIIYPFEEVGTMGYIYGFKFHYELYSLLYGQELPLTVWIGETLNGDLSGGWEPYENLTLVFDSLVITKNYEYEMFIPFDQPYLFTGGNIVIQIIQHDPSFPAAWTSFTITETPGVLRCAKSPDWYEIDPENPPSFENETQTWEAFPNITFVVNPFEDLASISGTVYDENANTMENTLVEVLGTAIKAQTNVQGTYDIPVLPYGEWTFNASVLGYEDNPQTITVDQENEVLDFTMVPKPSITLNGYVESDEAPGTPLEEVVIEITGYNNYTEATNDAGIFMLDDVFGNAEYMLHVSKFGYEPYAQAFDASNDNIDFGTIVLLHRVISVFDAGAAEGTEDEIAEIFWPDPLSGMEDTLRLDTGLETYGLTNEPLENVWLGNKMPNNDIITITSVDIFFINNPQTTGTVTIDIFDADENLLVTSPAFSTQEDSWMNIDFPNLTYDGDLFIMLHWKNNPASTHMLGIDFAPGIGNYCYIGYPGESFQILSDFLGTDPAAALIRANVLKHGTTDSPGSKSVSSYNLYRGESDDLYNIFDWTLVNSSPITDLEYIDQEWLNTEPNDYRYAVEANYVAGSAEVTFTNVISIGMIPPSNLDVVPNSGDATASFTWDSPMHDVQSYKIYLDNMNSPVATGITTTEFEFTDVPQGLHEAGVKAIYNTGESEIETFVFDQIVGINENQGVNISVYPNPASNFIMVQNAKDADLKICDLTGRALMQSKVYNDSYKIDISDLPQGFYMLIIAEENTSINRKLEIFR